MQKTMKTQDAKSIGEESKESYWGKAVSELEITDEASNASPLSYQSS